MKKVVSNILTIATVAILAVAPSFGATKGDCCDGGTCCGSTCCKTKRNGK